MKPWLETDVQHWEPQIKGLDPLPLQRPPQLDLVERSQKPKPSSSHHLETTGVKGNGRYRCSCTKYRPQKAAYPHNELGHLSKRNLKFPPAATPT